MPTSHDYNTRLDRAVLWWMTLSLTTAWLPLMRGMMDGPSYAWSTSIFGWALGGHGIAGDFWYVALRALGGLALLYAAWRRPMTPVRVVVAIYLLVLAADITWSAATAPDGFRFRGDTLGIDVSLTWVAPLLSCAFALIALSRLLPRRDASVARPLNSWTPAARRRLILAIGLIPAQAILLRLGDGMDVRDMIGVILTIAQWYLLNAAFAARPLRAPAS